jgi:hypothetical protein
VRLLVVGPPRSGTTWAAEALAEALGAWYVHEPDNPDLHAVAAGVVVRLGLCPVVEPGDDDPAYRGLWEAAIRGAPAAPGGVVVKSVNCAFSLEWVAALCAARVVLVRRNPLNIVASWLRQGWSVRDDLYGARHQVLDRVVAPLGLPTRPPSAGLALAAWWIALQLEVEERAAARHPGWLTLSHDHACFDPPGAFGAVLESLGMGDEGRMRAYLARSDRPGSGFETRRLSREQPDSWRRSLDAQQVAGAMGVFDAFPPARWKELLPAG